LIVIVVLLARRPEERHSAPEALPSERSRKPAAIIPKASASALGPRSALSKTPSCDFASEARAIASQVSLSVPVQVLALDGTTFAVGFAASRTHALGVKLTWPGLDVERVFEKSAGAALVGVIPVNAGGELEFLTDRVGGPLESPRSLNTKPRITVGAVAAGLGQWTRGRKPRVLWPGPAGREITVPRAAETERHGIVLTFRRGGNDGDVVMGWFSTDGQAKSELAFLDKPGKLSGTPSVATNDQQVLVSFANRAGKDQPWQVLAGSAALGKIPPRAEAVKDLPVGEGAAALSPAAGGLSNGSWLLRSCSGPRARAAPIGFACRCWTRT
jgi:hypothetical protein